MSASSFSLAEWTRVERWLVAAYDTPPADRAAFLDAHCPPAYRALIQDAIDSLPASPSDSDLLLSVEVVRALSDSAESSAPLNLMPERVGTYRLVRPLGQGGMGGVYLAESVIRPDEPPVALKLLRSDLFDEEAERRFRRERIILATLGHPGIAAFLDAGSSREGWPFFAMEYVEGRHLIDHARHLALGAAARLDLFEKACAAVAHAHAQRVVHCDLKPSNVIVSDSGVVKIIDFGIAKVLRPRIAAGAGGDSFLFSNQPCEGAHTPIYSAPEVCTADRRLGPEADVYSLGLLGRVLLQNTSDLTSELRRQLSLIWDRSMENDPAARYATASDLLGALRRARTSASGPQ